MAGSLQCVRGMLPAVLCAAALLCARPTEAVVVRRDATAWLYRGANLVTYTSGVFSQPQTDTALSDLRVTGANCICLVVTQYMATGTSNSIFSDATRTPSDASLVHAIKLAHGLGMAVILKPHVDCQDGTFRGAIAPTNVTAWQSSYRAMIQHYAQLAQTNGVEMLCIGTELTSMTQMPYTQFWHDLVLNTIKPSYTGLLTFAANWDAYQQVQFWGLMDYAGLEGYFELPKSVSAGSVRAEELWSDALPALRMWHQSIMKPVLLTEVGFCPVRYCTQTPSNPDLTQPYSETAQHDAYSGALSIISGEPWIVGVMFWNWDPFAAHPAADLKAYTPQDKSAQDVMSAAFGGPGAPASADPALFSFERGAERWVPQTTSGSQGVVSVNVSHTLAHQGNGCLQMNCNLAATDPQRRQGETYVDLRWLSLGAYGQPLDLRRQQITAWVWCPPGSMGPGSAPNGVQLFAKSGATWLSDYGQWINVVEGAWRQLTLTLDGTAASGGYMDPGFDASGVVAVGVKFALNSAVTTGSYSGSVFVDSVTVSDLGMSGPLPPTIAAVRQTATDPTKATVTVGRSPSDPARMTQYVVYRRCMSPLGPWVQIRQIAPTGADQYSFTDTGLGATSSYHYGVRAFNGWQSSDLVIADLGPAPDPSITPRAPTIVARRSSTDATVVNVTVGQSPDDPGGCTDYRVYRRCTSPLGPFVQVADIPATGATTYSVTDTGVDATLVFVYGVRALNVWRASGLVTCPLQGAVGTDPSITPRDPGIAAARVSGDPTQANVTISRSPDDPAGCIYYALYRRLTTPLQPWTQIATLAANGSATYSYGDTGLGPPMGYRYGVRAYNGAKCSNLVSVALGAAPGPAGPASVQAAALPTRGGGAQIVVGLAAAGRYDVEIVNLAGRVVRRLCAGRSGVAGANVVPWNARSDTGTRVPSGHYLVRVTLHTASGGQTQVVTGLTVGR